MPTILEKLVRQPTMDITRMQDIGGCRAVLPSLEVVDAVADRIGRHWQIYRVHDYVAEPKESGYRARHVVVERDERLVEIQLRTPEQQEWAEAVELVGGRLGISVKEGHGPSEVLEFSSSSVWRLLLSEPGNRSMMRPWPNSINSACRSAPS